MQDYGSLIWVTLQRSTTARDAIHVAAKLMADYGYASDGESFSISDQNEVRTGDLLTCAASKFTDASVVFPAIRSTMK